MEEFIDYRMSRSVQYKCPGCDYSTFKSENIRKHCLNSHKEIAEIDLEFSLIQQRYPTMCIDSLILAYLEKEETMISLLKKKILPDKFFRVTGIKRSAQEDKGIMSVISRRKKYFLESPEHRFKTQYLQSSITKLERAGMPESLIPAAKILKTIQFTQRQIKKKLKSLAEDT